MRLSFALVGLAICSLSGEICQAAPSIIAVVDGVDFSNSFVVTPIAQGFSITGSISNGLFSLEFDATTANANPDFNYRLSIGGDPTVHMTISQVFLGGPYPGLTGSSF